MEEAEDQYQMALRTHLVNLDTLIKLHDSRLYALERNFHQELRTLQTDFNKEKGVILGKFKQEKKELGAIIEAIEQEEENRDNEVSIDKFWTLMFCCWHEWAVYLRIKWGDHDNTTSRFYLAFKKYYEVSYFSFCIS